ncbi:hypothetical protein BJ742DRAFT_883719 [Cladochytrium replicatum]|nr:hypothetical protein BJ742DRAFT_883719 [Cladochytrium replicatum]
MPIGARTPFHPDALFLRFTLVSVIVVILLVACSVYFLETAAIRSGSGILVTSVVGGMFVSYLVNRIWSINIHQPAVNETGVTSSAVQPLVQYPPPNGPHTPYTPVLSTPAGYQAYAPPVVQYGGYPVHDGGVHVGPCQFAAH